MRWTTPLKPAARTGETFLERALCVLGAVAFAQFPEFAQQYLQRLGGALDEARRQLAHFELIASRAHLSLTDFIQRTRGNADTTVAQLADVIEGTQTRVNALSVAETALREASAWERPVVFLRHLDAALARGTLDVYRPAVPTTYEGAVYALAGIATVLVIYHGFIRYPVTQAWRRRQQRRTQLAATPPPAPSVPPSA